MYQNITIAVNYIHFVGKESSWHH